MIELKNIVKIFNSKDGSVHAVNGVDLKVEKGDVFGVIGFSGAGKSTLVRCINLLERPTSGQVIIENEDMMTLKESDLRKKRKRIGMIFQHFNLMSSRSVAQNIAYPLKGSKLSKEEIKKKVNDLLALVELSDKENAYPSQLSGGQKQRVAIARALANEPSVLLCDEATSALDPQTTQSILLLLKSLNEKLNITIVMITHEMSVVKSICNKVAIMEHGKVVEEGNIIDIFSNPRSEVTRNFIDTTTSIHQVMELLENNDPLLQVNANEKIVRLIYTSGNTKDPLMATLIKKFDVTMNILYGNVEVLSGKPLGNLVVKLEGNINKIEEAIQFIKNQDVKVEVLR